MTPNPGGQLTAHINRQTLNEGENTQIPKHKNTQDRPRDLNITFASLKTQEGGLESVDSKCNALFTVSFILFGNR